MASDDPPKRLGGYQQAGILSRATYHFVHPVIRLGVQQRIDEHTLQDLGYLPDADAAETLSAEFGATYRAVQAQHPSSSPAGLLWRTYLRLYKWRMLLQTFWTLCEVAVRVGSPLIMRQLVSWFVGNERQGSDAYPPSHGWMWAGILGCMGYAFALVHHQLFWVGMRMGFQMRLQAIAAVQAKVLRLNSAAVADVSPGKIVNMVSNDVRRLDDAATFWVFLVCSPIELAIVFVLVGLKLGFLASFAGISTLLLLIPAQGILVRYIGRLRANTAAQTDERVRLTSEAIDGILAAKMLSWEDPMLGRIRAIREREAAYIQRMARIRAINMALSFCIAPIVSLITFAVARATSQELTVANVFYALALLALPRVYMAEFFVRGVEFMSEVRVSIRRLGAFLQLPEPPAPVHAQQAQQSAGGKGGSQENGSTTEEGKPGVVAVRGADFDWDDRSWVPASSGKGSKEAQLVRGETPEQQQQQQKHQQQRPAQQQQEQSDGSCKVELQGPPGIGAAAQPDAAAPLDAAAQPASPTAAAAAAATHPTLKSLSFEAYKGQLVAIVGEVGSGKSSVLAALLGELQPMHSGRSITAMQGGSAGCKAAVAEDGGTTGSKGAAGLGGEEQPVVVRGRVAYCSQVPWIVSGSFKENILFGQPYEKQRYEAVLDACALRDDVAALLAGDQTELGERGINLSGGQKARLALARAAYSRADIQLLDDPLSAVDPRVGRVLFQQCIGPGGLMAGATRLLVTHQRQYLPACDAILVMEGGRIVDRGTQAELAARGVAHVIASHETELDDATYDSHTTGGGDRGEERPITLDDVPEGSSSDSGSPRGSPAKVQEGGGSKVEAEGEAAAAQSLDGSPLALAEPGGSVRSRRRLLASVSRGLSRILGRSQRGPLKRQSTAQGLRRSLSTMFAGPRARRGGNDAAAEAQQQQWTKSGKLVVGEDRASGGVAASVYGRYLGQMGMLPVLVISACLLGGQAAYLLGDYWLAQWASKDPAEQQRAYWVWGYAIFAGCITVVAIARSLLFFDVSLRASTRIHDAMAERVLRAPLSFFHTNPTGRVLNRFSRDQGAVDELLPQCLFDSIQALMMVLGSFILLMVVVPVIIPVFLPLGAAFFYVRSRYLATSRDVKRFEAVTRSPVYSSFSAILKGLPTIRAYGVGERFRTAFLSDLTANGSWWFCFLTTARWIGFRLDMLVALLMTAAPLLMMAMHTKLEARLAGLALTQSLQLGGLLQWMVRQTAEVENHMTSVERMLVYTQLEQEPPTVAQGGGKPPSDWPSGGTIDYRDVTAIYRPGLPPVLKGLSFTIQAGVSCGVVGRTGSGKSSLMLTLFRLIPLTRGSIRLDGVDTAGLGLDALRRQVAIIPQDPVLFSGTLRSNLDPWDQFEDHRLWEVLKAVQLSTAVSGLGGLDSRMSEAGDNLSVGQRQLFCLARALLQDSAILALDEATANVDRTTDTLIQQAVRDCCAVGVGGRRRTLLVIAHRIDTILDCDQLLVLNSGELVESGAPSELVRSGGVFARLVTAAQDASRRHQHHHEQQQQ